MPKVLVLGVSGYIGGGVARAFRRAGYSVYGVLRTTASVASQQELAKEEIVPVVGDMAHPETLRQLIEESNIIIDAVGYAPTATQGASFFDYVVEVKKKQDCKQKTLYIFTSGIMIYATGERVDFPIDESMTPKPRDTIEMVPKKAIEDHILSHNGVVAPVVVRPGFVYGGHGGVIASLFFDVKADQPEIVAWGGLDKRWSWVHIDDLSDAYVRLASHAARATVANQVFNVAALGDNPTFLELKYSCAKAAGWKGTKEAIKSQPVPEQEKRVQNWEWNVVINPRKAMDLLGWQPNHVGFLNEVGLYYQSWKATWK